MINPNSGNNPWDYQLRYKGFNLEKELVGYISRNSCFELFWVLAETKKVACIPIERRNLARVRDWCKKKGLQVVESGYSFEPITEPSKANYSNRAVFVVDNNPGAVKKSCLEVFVSKDLNYAKTAHALRFNDRAFGYAMGYPSCCIEAYATWLERAEDYQNDFIFPSIQSLGTFHYINNVALRCFGFSLVSHFPCSPQCIETIKIGERNYNFLLRYSPDLAKSIMHHLKSLVIYSKNDGIAYFTKFRKKKNLINLRWGFAVKNTRVHRLLSQHNEIVIDSYDSFSIGAKRFSKDCRIAFFS